MAELLGQNEIDALLAAVNDGGLDEVVAETIAEAEAPELNVAPYDFKRPERVGKDQIRALERLHEVFARNVGATLSSQLRTLIDCRLIGTEQATFQEFTLAVANPTCFNFIEVAELDGEFILDINPKLVFTMFDKLTGGGSSSFEPPNRAMTDLEWSVMEPTLTRILVQLQNAWEGLYKLTFSYGSHETNPQLAQNIAPNEPVVLITFEATIGSGQSGTISLCLPHNTIEPVLSRMTGYWLGSKVHRNDSTRENMRQQINDAPVELRCLFNPTDLTLNDLVDLEVGDVIKLGHPKGEPVVMEMAGQPAFKGHVGMMESRQRLCMRITENVAGDRIARLRSGAEAVATEGQ